MLLDVLRDELVEPLRRVILHDFTPFVLLALQKRVYTLRKIFLWSAAKKEKLAELFALCGLFYDFLIPTVFEAGDVIVTDVAIFVEN